MEKTIFCGLLGLLLFASNGAPACENSWTSYNGELCIKAFTDLETYQDAQQFCASIGEDTSLVMVKDDEIQQLLANAIEGLFDYIWLGGRYDFNSSQFKWEDGQPLNYTNWMAGYPRTDDLEESPCIELRPQEEMRSGLQEANNHGKWAHESCLKRNLVMCQKPMPWSLKDAVNAIKNLQQQHDQELLEVHEKMSNLNSELASANSKVQNLSSHLSNVNSEVASANSKIANMSFELSSVSSELTNTISELFNTNSKLAIANFTITSLSFELSNTKSELASANSKIANISSELSNVNSKLASANSELVSVNTKLAATNRELATVKTRVVPVGSIYVEYYNQPSPRSLWPGLSWQDITSTYAGLFFRALGGGAGGWGTIQSACAPRITQMSHTESSSGQYPNPISIPENGWSPYGDAGENKGAGWYEALRFYTLGCEVRPKNQAIKIWKRTA